MFVESYGRVAVEGSDFAPQVDAVLDEGTASAGRGGLRRAERVPHLADVRWDQLAGPLHACSPGCGSTPSSATTTSSPSDRLTLAGAFKRAGWRTVADVPSNERDWPEGRSFYGYDHDLRRHERRLRRPAFSYATMPDQYTLSAFQRLRARSPGPRAR